MGYSYRDHYKKNFDNLHVYLHKLKKTTSIVLPTSVVMDCFQLSLMALRCVLRNILSNLSY